MSSRWIDAGLALLLALLAVAWFSLSHAHGVEPRDEGHLLRLSALTAQGAMPHRDFSDAYGTGVFAVTGAALELANGRIIGVRRMLVAWKAALVMGVFGVAAAWAGRGWGAFAALLAIAFWGRHVWSLNTPYASVLTLPLLMAGFWSCSAGITRGSRAHLCAAGAWIGIAFFFKQSLAIYAAIGIGLAIWAAAMLSSGPRSSTGRGLITCWLLVAGLALLPIARSMEGRDYIVHFLPMHLLALGVALAVYCRGSAVDARTLWRSRLGPYVGGGLCAFALGAAPHVWTGAAMQTVDDMLLLPLELVNYHQTLPLPPLHVGMIPLAALCAVGSALAALRGRWRTASVALAMVVACLSTAAALAPAGDLAALLAGAPDGVSSLQHAALLTLALCGVLPWIAESGEHGAHARRFIPFLIFMSFLCFVIFPRSPVNDWTLMGPDAALMAIIVAILWPEVSQGLVGWRRAAAKGALASIPLWLASGPVAGTWEQSDFRVARIPVGFAVAEGLSVSPLERALGRFDELAEVIAWLGQAEPRTASLVLLTNQELILFASGRAPALPEYQSAFFTAGWGMLPPRRAASIDQAVLLRRLESHEAVFVVARDDAQADALRLTFPELVAGVRARSVEDAQIGSYTISRLRRADP